VVVSLVIDSVTKTSGCDSVAACRYLRSGSGGGVGVSVGRLEVELLVNAIPGGGIAPIGCGEQETVKSSLVGWLLD
jgi:hypothetical protein